jgi:hypothetical protein
MMRRLRVGDDAANGWRRDLVRAVFNPAGEARRMAADAR